MKPREENKIKWFFGKAIWWSLDPWLALLVPPPPTFPDHVLFSLEICDVLTITGFRCHAIQNRSNKKNQNRSTDKVQNLGNERRYIYEDPLQDSGQRNISYTRYPKKCFTQTYRDLYGDAMLVFTWMSSNPVEDGNQQKHLLPSFATKAWIYSSETHKH